MCFYDATNMGADHLAFWEALDELASSSDIVIDRAVATAHPRYPELVYPLDYGYLAGTVGGDGDGIDVWVSAGPDRMVTAVACTVDPLKRDAEIKLLLGCTESEIDAVSRFLEVDVGLPHTFLTRPGR